VTADPSFPRERAHPIPRPADRFALFVLASTAWTTACAEPNQAPFSCGQTPPQTVDAGDSVSFLPCFTDPDADPLTISAEVPHHLGPYVGASAAGETVTIHGRREHDPLPITIIATAPEWLHAVEEVAVTVRGLHDLAVLDAWPDSQTVRNGRFELHYVAANVGATHAKVAKWCPRISSDSVITTADPEYGGCFAYHLMPPGDTLPPLSFGFTNPPDPGEPYFGVCGESETPEYNLANNCSKGLKVIFPESTAEGLPHSPPTGSDEVSVRRFRTGASVRRRDDS